MQGPIEVLKEVSAKLEELNLNYFLVGSLASMYYSRPRFTNDIDLVVQISPLQIIDFCNVFTNEHFYCPPLDVVKDEVLRRGSFNLIHQASSIKIDIVLNKNSEISKSELSRRCKVELIPGYMTYIASPEDVILKKLEFYKEGYSEKHLSDVKDILCSVSTDQGYLANWVAKLGLEDAWQKAKN